MIPKIRKIHHPLGHTIETPLLIPSYSSKGFAITTEDDKEISEISEVMVNCAQFLTEIILVSAYDIHHRLIPDTKKFATTETTVIDSGGYETSKNFDFSTVKKYSIGNKDWTLANYEAVLNNWPEEYPNIIVSFDNDYRGKSIDEQVASAKSLFEKYPNSVNDYLIKPFTKRADYIDTDQILGNIKLLGQFDIIGITEVELGNSIQQRMSRIMEIRTALTKKGLDTPIHIFGSLDPVTSILYFLSGADIFDGLTWIRYAYLNGVAVYPANFGVLDEKRGIHLRDFQVQTQQLFSNLSTLFKLKNLMQKFITTNKLEVFNDLGMSDFDSKINNIMENFN